MPENGAEYRPSQEQSLIKEKMSPDTKLAIVVPVYAEYDNGNIFRLIDSFSRQSVATNQFEVVCVVNNSPDVAQKQTNAFLENQDTLDLEDVLKGTKPIPEGLSDYRREVLERARDKGLVVHMIDLSSQGIEKNIGRIRDIGLQEVSRRFQQNGQGEMGIVAQLDADTVVEPRYVQKVLQEFSRPEVDSLFINLDYFVPEGSKELFETSFHHQFKIAMEQWLNTVRLRSVEVGGPQSIGRVKAYREAGGISHQDMAEDFVLARNLSERTNYKFGSNIRVYTADRARAEGYDAQMRLDQMNDPEYSYKNTDEFRSSARAMFLRAELSAVLQEHPEFYDDESKLKQYFDKYGLPLNYDVLKEQVAKPVWRVRGDTPRPLHERFSLALSSHFEAINAPTTLSSNEYVDDTIAVFKSQVSEQEAAILDDIVQENNARARIRLNQTRSSIEQCIQQVFQQGSVDLTDFSHNPKTVEFLEANQWFLNEVNTLPEQYGSQEAATTALRTELPEYMEDYDKSRLRRSTAGLQALTQFVRRARNEPDKFPTTMAFLQLQQGK